MKKLIRIFTQNRNLRSGLRRRVLNLTYPLSKMPDELFTIDTRGIKITGNLRNAQDYVIFFYSAYEPYELDLIEFLTQKIPNSVCFDVGCNMGQHTMIMAKRASKVYAFDPLDIVRNIAIQRVKNNLIDCVSFHDFGLGDTDTTQDFFFDPDSQNNAMGSFIEDHDPNSKIAGTLKIRKGDNFINEMNITKLDLIKIDVEGFEAMVINGLLASIKKFKPYIMFEVTNSSIEPFNKLNIIEHLKKMEYRFFEIKRGKPFLIFFEKSNLRVTEIEQIRPRVASYNLLAVPKDKIHAIKEVIYH